MPGKKSSKKIGTRKNVYKTPSQRKIDAAEKAGEELGKNIKALFPDYAKKAKKSK